MNGIKFRKAIGGFQASPAAVRLERPLGQRVVIDDSANPRLNLGGLGCKEAAYQARFVGFNGWHTGPGMSGPPYYQPPQGCQIIARHLWRGQRAHLWQCWNQYAHGPTSFRVDII